MKAIKNFKHSLSYFPRQHLIVFGALLFILITSQLFTQHNQRKIVELNIAPEKLQSQGHSAIKKANSHSDWRWEAYRVKAGDSLSAIFSKMDISATILHRLLQSGGKAENLTRIYPGHKLRFGFDQQNGLVALEYIPSKTEQLIFIRKDDLQYTVDHVFKQPEIKLRYRSAILEDSLFMAGQKAGIDQGLIMQMANIFSGVVDFVYDPRKGDSFDILYEEEFLEGEKIGNGSILTASYSNEDETYTAYRYEFADGRSGYFNEDGVSMRKPFLRTPVDFARISSGFNLRRKHPIHKKIKAHRGIDYAAPRGTPVFAVGDARVQRAGFSRANGNYVFLQHGPTYVTKYLHLDKRYVKTGQKVKQRTVIGTVGSTGYSTGPHLHYEFLVNGVHRNPRTIFKKLPSAEPVPEDEKQRFKDQVTYLKLQYDNHKL
jgi:murein DD-endopeptidase MepM/ murein hydrolase activator NlpD